MIHPYPSGSISHMVHVYSAGAPPGVPPRTSAPNAQGRPREGANQAPVEMADVIFLQCNFIQRRYDMNICIYIYVYMYIHRIYIYIYIYTSI